MGNDTRDAVGVDIEGASDVHRLNTGEAAQFGDAAGFEELAAWIGSSADEVVYESTGPWHRAFEEALVERLPLTRVNALRARRFAQAMGQEAKTDKADAQVWRGWGRHCRCGGWRRGRRRGGTSTNCTRRGTGW